MTAVCAEQDGNNDQGITIELGELARLSACMFGIANAFYLTLSTAPAHLSSLGGDAAAGAATTISTVATAAASAFAPRLVAHLGRRAVFAIAALALGLPCFAVFGSSLAIAEIACAVRGAGLGLAFVAAGGLAARLAPPARRGEFLGLYGLAFSVPAIFAVPLGLWMLAHLGPAAIALAGSGCALMTLLGLGAFPRRAEQTPALPSWRLPWHRLGWPVIAQCGGAAAVGMMITVFASGSARTEATIAFAMFLHGLAAAFARWWGGRLGDNHGRRKIIAAGCMLSTVAALLLAADQTPAMVIGAGTLGLAFGLQRNGTLVLMLARTSAVEADEVNAAWNIAYDAGLGMGSLAYGCLAPMFGAQTAITAIAVAIAVAALVGFLLLERMRWLTSGQQRSSRADQPSPTAF
jgi:predicted MFS family arabinose efflux permease